MQLPGFGIEMQEDGYVDMADMRALLRAPRFWRQWVPEAEVLDVLHHNQKSRFEVQPKDGAYLVRACQGHSVSHVRDELLLTALSVRAKP